MKIVTDKKIRQLEIRIIDSIKHPDSAAVVAVM